MTQFKNIRAAIAAENKSQVKDKIDLINSRISLEGLNIWQITDLLPKGRKLNSLGNLDEAKAYLIKRVNKTFDLRLTKKLAQLAIIENAPAFEGLRVNLEWYKSNTWGYCPKGEGTDYKHSYLSGSVTGCGYDKQSAAVANVLNQSNSLLKLLYSHKENNFQVSNRELFGYGSGHGLLPYFEGGVGISCYPKIFEAIGCQFTTAASGKSFDSYLITVNN